MEDIREERQKNAQSIVANVLAESSTLQAKKNILHMYEITAAPDVVEIFQVARHDLERQIREK